MFELVRVDNVAPGDWRAILSDGFRHVEVITFLLTLWDYSRFRAIIQERGLELREYAPDAWQARVESFLRSGATRNSSGSGDTGRGE